LPASVSRTPDPPHDKRITRKTLRPYRRRSGRPFAQHFTLHEVGRLLSIWNATGEVGNGSYFWVADQLIVPEPGVLAMGAAIRELVTAVRSPPASDASRRAEAAGDRRADVTAHDRRLDADAECRRIQ
jgi:hypothetical protein